MEKIKENTSFILFLDLGVDVLISEGLFSTFERAEDNINSKDDASHARWAIEEWVVDGKIQKRWIRDSHSSQWYLEWERKGE